jgi:hypothetical protein
MITLKDFLELNLKDGELLEVTIDGDVCLDAVYYEHPSNGNAYLLFKQDISIGWKIDSSKTCWPEVKKAHPDCVRGWKIGYDLADLGIKGIKEINIKNSNKQQEEIQRYLETYGRFR